MVVDLKGDDNRNLVEILKSKDFVTSSDKLELIIENADLKTAVPAIDSAAEPDIRIWKVIKRLSEFGQDDYGNEALGRFLNYLIDANYVNDRQQKEFISSLVKEYNMMPPVSVTPERPVAKRSEPEESKLLLESIVGENTLRPISFLLRAIEVSRSVAYVGVPGGSGTGFLVGNNVLITNNHVIFDKSILDESFFRFNYQIGVNGQPEQTKDYKAVQNGLFHTNPDLDYSIVQLEESPGTEWGFSKLTVADPKIKSRVNIIQHAGGQPKQISIQNNFVEYVDNKIVQYLTSTLPGSSGSPVFDDNWRVVGLHHAGGMVTEPNTARSYHRNQGIRMSAILNDLPDNIRNILA